MRKSWDYSNVYNQKKSFLTSIPNKKNSDWSKLKAFADKKINVTKKLKFVSERVESIVWCPWSWGTASALQSWGPKFESRERVSILGFFIGPHIWREYWCSSQEAESREISISCKNLFLNRCKINMFKLKKKNIVGKGENAGYQHFLLFTQCFQKASFLTLSKTSPCFYVSAV